MLRYDNARFATNRLDDKLAWHAVPSHGVLVVMEHVNDLVIVRKV